MANKDINGPIDNGKQRRINKGILQRKQYTADTMKRQLCEKCLTCNTVEGFSKSNTNWFLCRNCGYFIQNWPLDDGKVGKHTGTTPNPKTAYAELTYDMSKWSWFLDSRDHCFMCGWLLTLLPWEEKKRCINEECK